MPGKRKRSDKSQWRKKALAIRTNNARDAAAAAAGLAPAHDDEDVELSDEDMDILDQFGRDGLSFLTDLDPKALASVKAAEKVAAPRAKGRIAVAADSDDDDDDDDDEDGDDEDSDIEAEYERRPRTDRSQDADIQSRLPIKTRDGQVVSAQADKAVSKLSAAVAKQSTKAGKAAQDADADADAELSLQDAEPMPAMAKQAAEPKKTAKPKKTFTESREMLAASATLILEEPEKHINELHKIRLAGNTSDERVTKLALLAQLAIFKDIIPGYRIRKLSEKELSTQISKDVKRLRQYEESLLQHYQLYLQQLEKLVSGPAPDGYERDSAPGIALVCMCDLLKSVPHFNFRLNIMTAILAAVRRVRRPDMVDLCCEAFEQLFRDDETGEYSLEAIKLIAKITKQSDYRIHKRVIETFLFLRLAEELQLDEGKRQKVDKGSSKSDKFKDKERKRPKSGRTQHVSKRQKKLSRAEAEVEAEVKEAEATIDRHERQKTHSETLKHVFITYFRILKQLPDSPLIMPALEGLGKFSHLISIDFFTDLLEAIKKICLYQLDKPAEGVQFSQQLSVGLQCILTVLELLASVKDAIKTDLLQFHSAMYRLISRVSLRASLVDPMHLRANYHSDRSIMELMMLALDLMLRRPHEVPIGRIAAFMKRMATMSLSLPDNGAIGSLVAMHKVFLRLPRLQSLLEGDERLGAGVYNPYVDDMDLCNPFATSLWELSTLSSKHYHPMVQSCAKMVLTHSDGSVAKPLPAELQRISRDRPMDLLDRFDAFGGNGLFSLRPACKAPPPMTKQPTNVYGPSVVMQSAFMEQLLARAKT